MIVEGIVKDAATGNTLPSATVAVYRQSDNYLIGGTQSDLEGRFQVGVLSGNYVKISYVGYRAAVPVLRAGSVNVVELQPEAADLPMATATAKRSYNAIILAVAAALLIYFIVKQ